MRTPAALSSLLVATALLLSGCVTRGYQLAEKNTPPAIALQLTSTSPTTSPAANPTPASETGLSAPPAAVPAPSPAITLQSVIVYEGPGSWKRQAYWDEYVVAITNSGETPLVVASSTLQAGNNPPLPPGDNPWHLEARSKKMMVDRALGRTGSYVAAGAGAAAAGAWAASLGAPATWAGSAASATALGAAGAVAVVALPVVATKIVVDRKARHVVEAEFTRRRLALPLTIAPGATAHGSLFFCVTPSPQQLAFHCTVGDHELDPVIDLSPLAELHVRKQTSPAPAPP